MLNIVVALPAEARPLINFYQLKRSHDIHAYPVYSNDDIQLIVTGIGRHYSAAATGFLAGLNPHIPMAWLNIGIAGGDAGLIGDLLLANHIVDADSQINYYPSICFEHTIPLAQLVSVVQPCQEYQRGIIFDMEAAGFYAAAMRFSTVEFIHCMKVISDNSDNSIDSLAYNQVPELIERHLPSINEVAGWLRQALRSLLISQYNDEEYKALLAQYHFTHTQRLKLKTSLQLWYAVTNTSPLQVLDMNNIANVSDLLRELETARDKLPVNY